MHDEGSWRRFRSERGLGGWGGRFEASKCVVGGVGGGGGDTSVTELIVGLKRAKKV